MPIHDDEIPVDEAVVRRLLQVQRPDLADLPVTRIGAGTDNTMYRVGDALLARLPRAPEKVASLRKELTWLPRLAAHLPCRIPEPRFTGSPSGDFPLPWAIYGWLDGELPGPATVDDWAQYGRDLAHVVDRLRSTELMGASRTGDLAGYRGGRLRSQDEWITADIARVRALPTGLAIDAVERTWLAGVSLPDSQAPEVFIHGDLRPGNVLVSDGRLHAVLDFGGLTVGSPDAEHAVVWDLPEAARAAYRAHLQVDDASWARAQAWAVAVAVSGVAYYWHTFPEFVAECLARLRAITGSPTSA